MVGKGLFRTVRVRPEPVGAWTDLRQAGRFPALLFLGKSPVQHEEDPMPNIAHLYFRTAIVFLLLGVAMGLHMAMSGQHNVIGPHAHTNLLGWVTMALFGGYYALNPAKAESRFAGIQYMTYATGVALMTVSLYLLYRGYASMEPVVAVSSLIVLAGIVMFAVIVFGREPVANPVRGEALRH